MTGVLRHIRALCLRHQVLWASAVGLLLVAASVVIIGLPDYGRPDPSRSWSDAPYYLSMASRDWFPPEFPAKTMPWSIHAIPSPFRLRVLVPALASLLPFGPVMSIAVVTYASFAATYACVLLTCRRLGLAMLPSVLGLIVTCAFSAALFPYRNPLMTDAFGLLVAAAMTYAYVCDRFVAFAAVGLIGLSAREATLSLLPMWMFRSVRRTLLLMVAAVLLLALLQRILYPLEPDEMTLRWALTRVMPYELGHPINFAAAAATAWGWGFALAAVGLVLLPRAALVEAGPAFAIALASAIASGMLALDLQRMFLVLLPAIAVGAASVATWLVRKRLWLVIAAGAVVAVLQLVMSWPNQFIDAATWQRGPQHLPMLKIGTLLMLWVVVALRHELAAAARGFGRRGAPAGSAHQTTAD